MDDLASLIVQGIPADAGFTSEDLWYAHILVNACHRVAARKVTPPDLGSDITRLRKDFGPWLDTVRRAIESVDMPAIERAKLLGAFEMATVMQFDATQRRITRSL